MATCHLTGNPCYCSAPALCRGATKVYRVVISIEVEAYDEDSACKEAMNTVMDDSMTIESIVEVIGGRS